MPEIELTALADAGAFVSQEHQEHLAEAFTMRALQVDPVAGSVSFADRDGVRTTWRAHFIGSASPADATWLWGWDNINGFPDPFVQQSRRIRAFGRKHAVAAFATSQLPLTDELPGRLVRAVKTLTGLTAHVVAPTGSGGTRAWLLVDDPALRLPPPTVARTVGVVMSGLAGSGVLDHRRALVAWAGQRNAAVEPSSDGAVRVHVSDGTVRVRFDDDDRIVGISTGRGGDERAPVLDPVPDGPPAQHAEVDPVDEPLIVDGDVPEPPGPPPPEPRRGWLSRLLHP